MKKLLIGLAHLLVVIGAMADTTFVSGVQSGTWSPEAGNPYLVTGVITVPAGESLTIQPGTRIEFTTSHGIVVRGVINCTGTESEPVEFTQNLGLHETRWQAIRVFSENPADTNIFAHTVFRNAQGYLGAVVVNSCAAVFDYCFFDDSNGYGIELTDGWARISNSQFDRGGNPGVFGGCGAGVSVYGSEVELSDSRFVGNFALDGGAVCFRMSDARVTGCEFEDNGALIWGGAVFAWDSDVLFDRCRFRNSIANVGGVARLDENRDVTFRRCVFDANDSGTGWYGLIEIESGTNYLFENCLFYGNLVDNTPPDHNLIFAGMNCHIRQTAFYGNSGAPLLRGEGIESVEYCSFTSTADFGDSLPVGLGQMVATNVNGDSVDMYGNLFAAPHFDDGGPHGEFSLSYGSPLINAGNPAGSTDPDGTIPDIGPHAFYMLNEITNLTVTRIEASSDLQLRWSAVTDAEVYWVFRTNSGEFGWDEAEFVGSTPSDEFVDAGGLDSPLTRRAYVVVAAQNGAANPLTMLGR